jgi:predicted DNA repair protein MutK
MSGLFALLDDIVAIAKLAAASLDDVGAAAGRASAKAAGVVIDDTAVTPRYVHGFSPDRELPVVMKIAVGSLRNKLLFILPAALLLSQFLPWLLTPILMVGGTYLCYEGAEKIWERIAGHSHAEQAPVVGGPDEKAMVSGAIRTDFILSAEIMVIALNQVAQEPLLSRAVTLVIVAIAMTVLVYGVVAVIVKMDDVGLHLATERTGWLAGLGRGLVAAMPKVLATLSTVGVIAMLWVGGHILLVGLNDLGWHAPYELVHHGEEAITHAIPGFVGEALAWVLNTAASAVIGVIAGAIVVAIMQLVRRFTPTKDPGVQPSGGKH